MITALVVVAGVILFVSLLGVVGWLDDFDYEILLQVLASCLWIGFNILLGLVVVGTASLVWWVNQ